MRESAVDDVDMVETSDPAFVQWLYEALVFHRGAVVDTKDHHATPKAPAPYARLGHLTSEVDPLGGVDHVLRRTGGFFDRVAVDVFDVRSDHDVEALA